MLRYHSVDYIGQFVGLDGQFEGLDDQDCIAGDLLDLDGECFECFNFYADVCRHFVSQEFTDTSYHSCGNLRMTSEYSGKHLVSFDFIITQTIITSFRYNSD